MPFPTADSGATSPVPDRSRAADPSRRRRAWPRFFARRHWRAIPELDVFDDEDARRFLRVARARGAVRHVHRLVIVVAALAAFLVAAIVLAIIGWRMYRGHWERLLEHDTGTLVIGAITCVVALVVVPLFTALLLRDHFIRVRLRDALATPGRCLACDHSLIGLEIPESRRLVCPVCSHPCVVDATVGASVPGGSTRSTIDAASVAKLELNLKHHRRRRRIRVAVIASAIILLFIVAPLAVHEVRIRRDAALARAEAPTSADVAALIAAHRPGATIATSPRVITLIERHASRVASLENAAWAARQGPYTVHYGYSLLTASESLAEPGTPQGAIDQSAFDSAREVLGELEALGAIAALRDIASEPVEVREVRNLTQLLVPTQLQFCRSSRQLARMLCARAILAIERGDVDTARLSLDWAGAIARACAAQPTLIEWLTASAIDSLILGVARQWLASVPSAAELDAIEAVLLRTPPMPSSEMAERIDGVFQATQLASMIEDLDSMRALRLFGVIDRSSSAGVRSPGGWRANREAIAAMIDHVCAARRLEPFERALPSALAPRPTFDGAGLAAFLCERLTKYPYSSDMEPALQRADAIALALERWRLAHGDYPVSIDALVPELLPRLPIDPWSGRPMRYRRVDPADDAHGRRYLIYVFGPDEIDDGGREPPPHYFWNPRPFYEPPHGFDAPLNRAQPVRRVPHDSDLQ